MYGNQGNIETKPQHVQPAVGVTPPPAGQLENRNLSKCGFCGGALLRTKVAGLKTWFYGCLLFTFTGVICGLIPCFIDDCKDDKYICQNCQRWNYTR